MLSRSGVKRVEELLLDSRGLHVAIGCRHDAAAGVGQPTVIHHKMFISLAITVRMVRWTGIVLKVRVVACLLGGDAAGGIIHKHHLEEIEARIVKVLAKRLGVITHPLREGRLEVGVRGDAWPDVFAWSAKQSTEAKC
jgi:hypothetical protein